MPNVYVLIHTHDTIMKAGLFIKIKSPVDGNGFMKICWYG